MLQAVGQHCIDFPSGNCVELYHFIIHCFHSHRPYLDVSSSLGTGKSSLCRTGLMADDKFGCCTIYIDFALKPDILVSQK
jgi:hypothetical protein